MLTVFIAAPHVRRRLQDHAIDTKSVKSISRSGHVTVELCDLAALSSPTALVQDPHQMRWSLNQSSC